MANKRSDKHDYTVVDSYINWLKKMHGFERGKDFRIFPRFNPKTGSLMVIRLMPTSPIMKAALKKDPQIMANHNAVTDGVDQADDGAILIRFAKKQRQGTEPKAKKMLKAGKKIRSRKKRSIKKVGQKKLAQGKVDRKRIQKMRLPRNASKPVKYLFSTMNEMLSDTQRAEFLKAVAKYIPKERMANLRNRGILTKQAREKLAKKITRLLAE